MLQNKKTNRKQKRFLKKIVFFYSFLAAFCVISLGIYFAFIKFYPESVYVSPISHLMPFGSKEDTKIEELRKQLQEKQITYVKINTISIGYSIKLENGREVVISKYKDISSQISSLQFILTRLTMEGRQFKKLDLQFEKPVIVFRN